MIMLMLRKSFDMFLNYLTLPRFGISKLLWY